MKKLTLFIAACLISVGIFAQQFTVKDVYKAPSPFNYSIDKTIDTLMGPAFYYFAPGTCVDTVVYYNVGTGYLTGNGSVSGYVMNECSQAYDNAIAGNVVGAVGIINLIAGTTGTFTAKAYTVNLVYAHKYEGRN